MINICETILRRYNSIQIVYNRSKRWMGNPRRIYGFAKLEKLDAGSIADAILHLTDKIRLDMTKLIGLGFDGCSKMAGKDTGV
ncbi:hypothetical protein QYM36_001618 [Artemia franciscana]|uniref:DUF4371 domain-containing protein n=1 Tax=Artemia franciscana TaxID=6661 RepID=A0AA88IEJ4_ARTSF|nr:hypothetical protein QYM36_001618 [Artemia franciscana]